MYRFDDKQRRRLLEDALVADLLDGPSEEHPRTQGAGSAGTASATTVAATPVGNVRVSKRGA